MISDRAGCWGEGVAAGSQRINQGGKNYGKKALL